MDIKRFSILTTYNNAEDLQGAYSAWTDKSNLLTIKTTIGDNFVDKIQINTDSVRTSQSSTSCVLQKYLRL